MDYEHAFGVVRAHLAQYIQNETLPDDTPDGRSALDFPWIVNPAEVAVISLDDLEDFNRDILDNNIVFCVDLDTDDNATNAFGGYWEYLEPDNGAIFVWMRLHVPDYDTGDTINGGAHAAVYSGSNPAGWLSAMRAAYLKYEADLFVRSGLNIFIPRLARVVKKSDEHNAARLEACKALMAGLRQQAADYEIAISQLRERKEDLEDIPL